MPTVTNPTTRDLYCAPLDRVILARQTVDATPAEAAAVSGVVFVVAESAEPEATAEEVTEPAPQPLPEPEPAAEESAENDVPAELRDEPEAS